MAFFITNHAATFSLPCLLQHCVVDHFFYDYAIRRRQVSASYAYAADWSAPYIAFSEDFLRKEFMKQKQ